MNILSVLIFIFLPISILAQEVRPVLDDIGYPWTEKSTQALVDYLEKENAYPDIARDGFGRAIAGIVPHDDYLYSAPTGFPLFRQIKAKEVIIFGVTHSSPRKFLKNPNGKIILDTHKKWTGPLGEIDISPLRDIIKEHFSADELIISDQAHRMEHSIEAMLPFIQVFNPQVKVTPIMVSAMDFGKMEHLAKSLGNVIFKYMSEQQLTLGKDLFLLVSCDATHYGSDFKHTPYGSSQKGHDQAVEEDKRLVRKYLIDKLDKSRIKGFTGSSSPIKNSWCGRFSVPFGLLTIHDLAGRFTSDPIRGTLIQYADSYSNGALPVTGLGMGTTAPFNLNHWVGYVSIVYTFEHSDLKKSNMESD